jgi:hypothetical protein
MCHNHLLLERSGGRLSGLQSEQLTGESAGNLLEHMIAITGQSLSIFIQVVWSFLISVRILMRRMESLRRRLRALPLGRERRNISMTC